MNTPLLETIDALLSKHPAFLTFPKDVENYFQQKIKAKRVRHIFYSSLVGTLVYLLFAVSDYVLLPDIFMEVWEFRFFIGFPVLIAACILFRYIGNYKLREPFMALAGGLVVAYTCWLILQSRGPLAVQELAGFCLFLVYSNVVVRYRFTLAFVVSILFLVFFVIVSLQAVHISSAAHLNNFILLFSTAVLSLIGNYWHEIEERRSFLLAVRDSERKEQLRHANYTLEGLSYRDGLTSAYNKRYFDKLFPTLLSNAEEARTPLSVIFIDIDHFKSYNDNYGHVAGDHALVRVAELLNAAFRRRGEIVARTGGEEFVGLLPGLSLEQASEIAEKIRQSVEELGIPHEYSSIAKVVTVSIGVAAALPGYLSTPQNLLNFADGALYKAKQRGRNRVVIQEDLPLTVNTVVPTQAN